MHQRVKRKKIRIKTRKRIITRIRIENEIEIGRRKAKKRIRRIKKQKKEVYLHPDITQRKE